MKSVELGQGVIVPMITPFMQNGDIDFDAVAKLTGYIIEGGAAPFILGTTGESASIPESGRPEFVEQMVLVAAGRAKTYAGISSTSYFTSLEAARISFDLGVDAVVAHPPAYYPLDDDQMLRYFEQLADHIPGPLILYNITSVTHVSIPLSVADRLSTHEKIIGLKDSERDIERLNQALELWSDRPDFKYLCGWGAQMTESLIRGGAGLVPSTGNLVPHIYYDLYMAVKAGEVETAQTLQKITDEISAVYQKSRTLSGSLSALKVLLNHRELCQPHVLPPLYRLGEDEERTLCSEFDRLDLQFSTT